MTKPIIEIKNLSAGYDGRNVLHDINLAVYERDFLGIIGPNGGGKTTLVKCILGLLKPTGGEISFNCKPSLGYLPQYSTIDRKFPISVEEVILSGLSIQKSLTSRFTPEQKEKGKQIIARMGLEGLEHRAIGQLSGGQLQRALLGRAIISDPSVLILDEPTAVLTPPEIVQLSRALRRMADEGKAVVFISHKMREVLDLADEVAVLRRGEIVDEFTRGEVPDERELAARMIGHEMERVAPPAPFSGEGECLLRVERASCGRMRDVGLVLRRGEILAVAGVAGNGQRELVEMLVGLRRPESGRVEILGRDWQRFFREPIRGEGGLAYIPEDRRGLATCPALDLTDNFLLTNRFFFARGPFLNRRGAEAATRETIKEFNVLPGDPRAEAAALSGGNLQKLVLGREFYRNPRLIVAENPTQGLDVGATEEVWRRLLSARDHAGVLLVTGDLHEAVTLADTIAVMYRGRFMDVFPRGDTAKLASIGLLMAGMRPGANDGAAA